MVRGLVNQIDPKKELKFRTTLIIVLLKEQYTFTRGVQQYVIKFVSDLRQIGGFQRVLWFPPPRAAKIIFGSQEKRKLGPPPPILQIMILKLSPPRCVISKESVQQTLIDEL